MYTSKSLQKYPLCVFKLPKNKIWVKENAAIISQFNYQEYIVSFGSVHILRKFKEGGEGVWAGAYLI